MKRLLLSGQLSMLFLFTLPTLLLAQTDCVTTISGNVYYYGIQTGMIHIALMNENDSSFTAETSISAPGPYELSFTHSPNAPLKTYWVVAQLDVNNSGTLSPESFQQDEPSGHYDGPCGEGDAITHGDCGTIQGIDIYLSEYKQKSVLHKILEPDYFTGYEHDMGYYDGHLWICDQTGMVNGPDIRKVNPENGQLIESYDLGIDRISSLEWIGNDLWICFKDDALWKIRKYTFDGTMFTQGISYSLPTSTDMDTIWSVNIAWDGNLLWVQEKGPCGYIHKMDLSTGSIVQTIPADDFGHNKHLGTGDISDICFSDGYLWVMNDDSPMFARYDPFDLINSGDVNYTFDPVKNTDWEHQYSFEEDGIDYKYNGMVKNGDLIYFLQRSDSDSPQYKILVAGLDQCVYETTNLAAVAANFGRFGCSEAGGCVGDLDRDDDVDGSDLAAFLSCRY